LFKEKMTKIVKFLIQAVDKGENRDKPEKNYQVNGDQNV